MICGTVFDCLIDMASVIRLQWNIVLLNNHRLVVVAVRIELVKDN